MYSVVEHIAGPLYVAIPLRSEVGLAGTLTLWSRITTGTKKVNTDGSSVPRLIRGCAFIYKVLDNVKEWAL